MSDHPSIDLSRRAFIGNSALAAGALITGIAANAAQTKSRPNILFIMTDDHAAQAMSCYGSKINQKLKQELYRLKREVKDDDQFAETQPTESSYVQAPLRKR